MIFNPEGKITIRPTISGTNFRAYIVEDKNTVNFPTLFEFLEDGFKFEWDFRNVEGHIDEHYFLYRFIKYVEERRPEKDVDFLNRIIRKGGLIDYIYELETELKNSVREAV